MAESEAIDKVVNALLKVPEKQLLIIELVNSIPIKNCNLDLNVIEAKQPEINLAIAEAKAYGGYTIKAVDSLIRLKARTQNVGP